MRLSNREIFNKEWEEFLQLSKKKPKQYTEEDEIRVIELRRLFSDARGSNRHIKYIMTDTDGSQYISDTVIALSKELECTPQVIDGFIRRGAVVAKGQFKGCTFEKVERQSHIGEDGSRYWVSVSSLKDKAPVKV